MLDSEINVKLDKFDGPLGLLLLLVQKEEMNISDLHLTEITEQYLSYLQKMEELNFDVAGDFLFMAATLVLLKSKSCISGQDIAALMGEEIEGELKITSKAELIKRLEDLQKFQELGTRLWGLPRKNEDIYVRPRLKRDDKFQMAFSQLEITKVTMAMMDFMQRQKRRFKFVKRDRLSIKEKLVFLKNFLHVGSQTTMGEILNADKESAKKEKSHTNMVITFISLLELARLRRIKLFQNEAYSEVYVDVIRNLQDFDVNAADGFDSESEAEDSEEDSVEDEGLAQMEAATKIVQ